MLQKNSLEGPLELAAELPAEIPWFSALIFTSGCPSSGEDPAGRWWMRHRPRELKDGPVAATPGVHLPPGPWEGTTGKPRPHFF